MEGGLEDLGDEDNVGTDGVRTTTRHDIKCTRRGDVRVPWTGGGIVQSVTWLDRKGN